MSLTGGKFRSEDECLVHGYVRNVTHNVPKEIIRICVLFYALYDDWDKNAMNEGIILKKHGIIEMSQNKESMNAYLTKEFDSGYNYWEFKVISLNTQYMQHSDTITVGIINVDPKTGFDSTNLPLECHWTTDTDGKGSSICCNSLMEDGTRLKEGDIIKLIVDMDKLQLNIHINDNQYTQKKVRSGLMLPRKIERSRYRVGVNLFIKRDSIQLI